MIYVDDEALIEITDDLGKCPTPNELRDKFFSTSEDPAARVLGFDLDIIDPETEKPARLQMRIRGLERNEEAPGRAWLILGTIIPNCPIKTRESEKHGRTVDVLVHFSFEEGARNYWCVDHHY